MPIVRKSILKRHLDDLESRYQDLIKAVEGDEPNHGNWDQHALSESDYGRDFAHINPDDIEFAVTNLRSQLNIVKKLQKHKEPRLHKDK